MRREILAASGALALGLILCAATRVHEPQPVSGRAARVISLAPSTTETVFALGAGRRVVGVSSGVTWPPEAIEAVEKGRAVRVGGYLDADLERIVGLRPDVILIQGMHAYVKDQAKVLGIPVRRMRMGTLAEIRGAVRGIGECLGVPDAAEDLVARIDGDLDRVRARSRARGRAPLRTFLHVAHGPASPRPPFLTTGSGTFLTEALEIAGGANVFADSPRPYPEASVESVIERAPEVVMVSVPGVRLSAEAASLVRDAWRELLPERPGRSAARVVFLTADCAQVPGPRVGLLAVEMEKLLWAESAGREEGGHGDVCEVVAWSSGP